MWGIPFTIRRFEEGGNVKDDVVYLRTARVSVAGKAMRAKIREYHRFQFEQTKAAALAGVAMAKAMQIEEGQTVDVEAVLSRQTAAMEQAQELAAKSLEVAEQIALAALADNYGERAGEVVDSLTDRELHAVVSSIELGEMPRDFFQSPGTRPTPSGTGPSGMLSESGSSKPGSPAAM